MANKINILVELFTGVAFVVVIAISMALAGCGTEDAQTSTPSVLSSNNQASSAREVSTSTTIPLDEAPVIETPVTVTTEPREVTFEEAEIAYNERRYDDAAQLFGLYTNRKNQNPWGYYMLGLSAMKSGNLDNAETAFEYALELDPRHVKSWLNLSRTLIEADRPQDALDKISEALILDPHSNVAYRLEGRAYDQLGMDGDAAASYREAILNEREDVWSMNNLALVAINDGDFEDAVRILARATELRNDNALFYNNLGMALENTGQIRDAEVAYGAAVALDAGYDKAATNLARVKEVVEEFDVVPVDLKALAAAFVDEIDSWMDDSYAHDQIDSVKVDVEIVVGEGVDDAAVDTAGGDTGEDDDADETVDGFDYFPRH